jgi:hypothetical protein
MFRTYEIIILPVVLYGCETWSLTLREKHRLRVFENKVLRRNFSPKRDDMTGVGENCINEGLPDLCTSKLSGRGYRLGANYSPHVFKMF